MALTSGAVAIGSSAAGNSAGISKSPCLRRDTMVMAQINSPRESLPSALTSARRQICESSEVGKPDPSKKLRASAGPSRPLAALSKPPKKP
eukprot:CAMPEP_0169363906 /NCGR_PEP_ID=MMETSP1017-20121227/31711_1 /TAXON_ID=342587 /ORGANISM="Karlodinium micrum, Strain CCMP2283" /LENGTH=90 /DNA_ID=CAMNT_0009461563 /DNA_START=281 /DNA_END=553 /DNA_ORIENTATION=-